MRATLEFIGWRRSELEGRDRVQLTSAFAFAAENARTSSDTRASSLARCQNSRAVMVYAMEQRRREMGVRLAPGAAPAALLRLVVKEGLVLAGIGLVAGVLLAAGVSQSLVGLLYETRPTDPRIFAGVAAGLLAVAVLATLVPARRATQVDPALVLRDQ